MQNQNIEPNGSTSTQPGLPALDAFGCINNTIKVAQGHYVDLKKPDPNTIEIRSIAAALSKICRFGGHCPRFYSVAEHCIHATSLAMNDRVSNKGLGAVFLHDAAEAYLGDMVKPLKIIMPGYSIAESRMEHAIELAFGISFHDFADTIKKYDRAMLKAEKTRFWPQDSEQWAGFSEIPDVQVPFRFWEPRYAEAEFMSMARSLFLNGAH